MAESFVHLRLHSEFSMTDSLLRIKPLLKQTAALSMPALALTDRANLCGWVRFYKEANAKGVKPLIGADIWVQDPEFSSEPFPLLLLCRHHQGYLRLSELLSQGYLAGQPDGRVLIQWSWLAEQPQGFIVLSGAQFGDVGQRLLAGDPDGARLRLERWRALFPDAYYLELQRLGRPGETEYLPAVLALAQATQTPVVATNDVRFMSPDDFEAHEARVCISTSWTLDDPRRPRDYSAEQYLKSPQQMQQLFADVPSALANSRHIAERCSVGMVLGKNFLPDYPVPAGMTMDEYFRQLGREGMTERLKILLPAETPEREAKAQVYWQRLELELDVIIQMGFPGYFLIVADFIRWAKENAVPVGPGRGSGAGSMVAYALLITDLDPLAFDLLFERFLNPERVSMPDFDIDFCMEGRDRVIDYVAQKYGRHAVSQIITFGAMAAKAVVRDVGRVLGFPYGFVDKISKLIPLDLGICLKDAFEQEEQIRKRYETEDDFRELWDLALKLEGLTRQAGKHAGGVVIAPTKISDFAPLYCDAEGQNPVTQFDKDDVEQVGLVKFDFLGLRTLTIIDWALQTLNRQLQQQAKPPIDIALIPLDDPASFALLQEATTTAVFQLESRGMKELIKRLQPSCFEDIIALVALYRPGPLQSGMVDDFINRKHGRADVAYPHPDLEPVLKPTYGVILYQEQVMQIAQVLSGYTLGGADMLRRAMGKKKPEEMAKQRSLFTDGAVARGVDAQVATYIFDLMEKFAGYGFNKSHSAAYALVSYQTAWMKAHYPAAFMAAVLSSDMDNTDKVVGFIEECRRLQLDIVPPNVNLSQFRFEVDADNRVIYGLGAVKGVGENAIDSILSARAEAGPFTDFIDFCRRIDLRKVNKRVLEALIKAGALDVLGTHRANLMAAIERVVSAVEQEQQNAEQGQADLFAEGGSATEVRIELPQLPPWPQQEQLWGERDSLGLYLTGHPCQAFSQEFRRLGLLPIGDLRPTNRRDTLRTAGLIVGLRQTLTKKGQKLAILQLEDPSGRIELSLFAELIDQYQALLVKDQIIVVSGEVRFDEFSGGLRMSASTLWSMAELRAERVKAVLLRVPAAMVSRNFRARLAALFKSHAGNCPVRLEYQRPDASLVLDLGADFRLALTDECKLACEQLLGPGQVFWVYEH